MKDKLSKLIVLSKNKELIKEAVEVYLNQSSSFTSLNSNELLSYWTKRKEQLIQYLTQDNDFRDQRQKEHLEKELTTANEILNPDGEEIRAFKSQKEKNEKIVKECKKLLRELE